MSEQFKNDVLPKVLHSDFRLLFTPEEIAERVLQLATQINAAYAGEQLVVICVLKGAFMFFSDLVKHLHGNPKLDFVRVSSYANKAESSKAISFSKDIEISLHGKHVLLVEDVVDTGYTIRFLCDQMQARGAASVHVAALVDKAERREVAVQVDFTGFAISEGFIVGYGLDYAEMFRNLPAVYVAKPGFDLTVLHNDFCK